MRSGRDVRRTSFPLPTLMLSVRTKNVRCTEKCIIRISMHDNMKLQLSVDVVLEASISQNKQVTRFRIVCLCGAPTEERLPSPYLPGSVGYNSDHKSTTDCIALLCNPRDQKCTISKKKQNLRPLNAAGLNAAAKRPEPQCMALRGVIARPFFGINKTDNGRQPPCANTHILPPRESLDVAVSILDNTLSILAPSNECILVLGDLNVNFFIDNKINQCFQSYSLHQLLNEPTRIIDHSSTLLDPVFFNCAQRCSKFRLVDISTVLDAIRSIKSNSSDTPLCGNLDSYKLQD
ncbi:unnamed protein product [Acanthoscelides obtectus]|uniref:Endonuclease/exonuclease/phosphatase domain-containing protein n=1 Tax=Acanthoscelides obtectus TaxID=200917 RepID=A0A9P0K3V7_ACAOB|nr:unnamed protein product [Acanthoscelides obtectus]CAK1646695.1 hypothetical protein AOBTE_LOCUS14823 [Acanthoscelides obtectus]